MVLRSTLCALVLFMAACSRGAAPTDTSEVTASTNVEPPTASPTLRTDPPPGDEMTITGVFGSVAVEGGCPYLQTDDKTRYEVIYPKGWQLDRGAATLRNPDGKVVATGGETITVRGQLAVDRVSICQIGRIFGATEVVTIAR